MVSVYHVIFSVFLEITVGVIVVRLDSIQLAIEKL
jgi:hypothetical protein